jgi:hypothetical protein
MEQRAKPEAVTATGGDSTQAFFTTNGKKSLKGFQRVEVEIKVREFISQAGEEPGG